MKKGQVLVAVVMIVVILGISGVAFLHMASLESLQTRKEIWYFQALDLAEAGIERAMWRLSKNPNWRDGYESEELGNGYYTVSLRDNPGGTVLITSTGYVRNISKTVIAEVQVSSASGTPAISYTEGTSRGNLARFPGRYGDPGQSFRTGNKSIKVVKVELQMKKSNPNVSSIYLTIRKGSTVGQILGRSQTVRSSQIPRGNAKWVAFYFSPPVNLKADRKYYLRLSSIPPSTDPDSDARGTVRWVYSHSSRGYPDGEAYIYIGRCGRPNYQGVRLYNYDFNFKIYEESGEVKIIDWQEQPSENI